MSIIVIIVIIIIIMIVVVTNIRTHGWHRVQHGVVTVEQLQRMAVSLLYSTYVLVSITHNT